MAISKIKVSGNYAITRSDRVQKRQKKKTFYGTFSLAVFLFPVIKRAEKITGFLFFTSGEREKVKYIIKKKKIFFCPLGSFFDHFWSLACRKR